MAPSLTGTREEAKERVMVRARKWWPRARKEQIERIAEFALQTTEIIFQNVAASMVEPEGRS